MPGIVRQGDFHAGHAQPAQPFYHTGTFVSTLPTVLVNSRPAIRAGDPSICGATANQGWVVNVKAGGQPVHHMFAPVSSHGGPAPGLHSTVTPQGSLNVLVGSTLAGVTGALFKLPFPTDGAGAVTSPVLGDTSSKGAGLPSAADVLAGHKTELAAGTDAMTNDFLEYGEGALATAGVAAGLLVDSPLFDKADEDEPEIELKAGPSNNGSGAKFNVVIYGIDGKQYFQVKRGDDAEYWNWEPTAGPETTEAFPVRSGTNYRKDDILIVDADQFLWPLEGQHHILVVKVLNVEKKISDTFNPGPADKARLTGGPSSTVNGRNYTVTQGTYGLAGVDASQYAENDIVAVTGGGLNVVHDGGENGGTKKIDIGRQYFQVRNGTFVHAFAEPFVWVPPQRLKEKAKPAVPAGPDGTGGSPATPAVYDDAVINSISIDSQAGISDDSQEGQIFKVTWRGNPFAPNKFRLATKTVTKKDADGNDVTEKVVAAPVTAAPNAVLVAGATYRIRSIDESAETPVAAWQKLGFDDRYAEAVPDLYFAVPADTNVVDLAFEASAFGSGTVVQEVESAAVVQQAFVKKGSENHAAAGFYKLKDEDKENFVPPESSGIGDDEKNDYDFWFRPVFSYEVEPGIPDIPAGLISNPAIPGLSYMGHVDARFAPEFADILRSAVSHYTSNGGANRDLRVVSAFRHERFNKAAAGAPNSFHAKGQAADVIVASGAGRDQADWEIFIKACIEAGAGGIGVQYARGFVHLDAGPRRAWGPDGSRNSLPEWAKTILKEAHYI